MLSLKRQQWPGLWTALELKTCAGIWTLARLAIRNAHIASLLQAGGKVALLVLALLVSGFLTKLKRSKAPFAPQGQEGAFALNIEHT